MNKASFQFILNEDKCELHASLREDDVKCLNSGLYDDKNKATSGIGSIIQLTVANLIFKLVKDLKDELRAPEDILDIKENVVPYLTDCVQSSADKMVAELIKDLSND